MIIDKFKNLEIYKNATSNDVSEEYKDWQYDLDTTNIVHLVAELEQLLIHSVVGQSEQFKCDCGCTNYYKNEMHDSVMCADCGTVYARI